MRRDDRVDALAHGAKPRAPPGTRFQRAIELALECLSRRSATPLTIALATLLTSTALAFPLSLDDYFHAITQRGDSSLSGLERAPWDLYSFTTSARDTQQLIEEGIAAWWTDPELAIRFFRPLTSLSLAFDHFAWPERPMLMHLHSLLWFALLLWTVGTVYRELAGSPRLAAVSLLFYAIDDAHSMPAAWTAQRNALIALVPGFFALVAHHRFRSGRGRAWGWLGPLSLAVGLLGGETALAVFGYLLAYAVFLDRGSGPARARSLIPYGLLLVGYRLVYNALGFGALYSGMYLDPGRSPLQFGEALATRLPVLLLAEFALPMSDMWELYPVFAPWLRPLVLAIAVLVLGGLCALLRPLWRTDPTVRFWMLGTLLATLPVCGIIPEDRLLTATSLGGAALVSRFLLALWERDYPNPSRFARASGAGLFGIHALIAPLLLPVRAIDIQGMEVAMDYADRSLPRHAGAIRDQTVILLNPPLDLFGLCVPLFREAKGLPQPKHFRWLATGESALSVERVDARTLRITPADGFLSSSSQQMFRMVERRFRRDETVALEGVRFSVPRLTADGRPAEVLVRFDRELEHPSLRWMQWRRHDYVPFTPPELGQSVLVPKVDLMTTLFEDPRGAERL